MELVSAKLPQVDLRGFLSLVSYFAARPNRAIFRTLRWNASRATRVLLGVRGQGICELGILVNVSCL
jgi:hypothetical protein